MQLPARTHICGTIGPRVQGNRREGNTVGEDMAKPRNQIQQIAEPRNLYRVRGKISYDLIDVLVENARKSLYLETACAIAGVTHNTVQTWLKEGKDILGRIESGQLYASQCTPKQAMCVDLYIEMHEALANTEMDDVQRMEALAQLGDFRAVKFRLERRSPERWGKRDALSIDNGNQGQAPRIVNYQEEIAEAPEFAMLEESYPEEDIEDAEVIEETNA